MCCLFFPRCPWQRAERPQFPANGHPAWHGPARHHAWPAQNKTIKQKQSLKKHSKTNRRTMLASRLGLHVTGFGRNRVSIWSRDISCMTIQIQVKRYFKVNSKVDSNVTATTANAIQGKGPLEPLGKFFVGILFASFLNLCELFREPLGTIVGFGNIWEPLMTFGDFW